MVRLNHPIRFRIGCEHSFVTILDPHLSTEDVPPASQQPVNQYSGAGFSSDVVANLSPG